MQAKEWGNAKLKCIVSQSLDNGVRTISKWSEFMIGSGKPFLLQMQPHFVAHLKRVALDDDHVTACTWHLISPECRGPTGRYVGCVQ